MNSLPKTVIRQRRDCDLNPGPSAPESSTLTTRLPSHPPFHPAYTNNLCINVRSKPDGSQRNTARNRTDREKKQVCWICLQSDHNLRCPPVARQQAPAIDRYLLPAPDLSSKPAGCRCCCRSTGQTDGHSIVYDTYRILRGARDDRRKIGIKTKETVPKSSIIGVNGGVIPSAGN